MKRKQAIHAWRFGYDVSVRSENPYPVDGSLAGARIFQFLSESIDSVRLFQFGSDRGQFVSEDGVIFFEGVADNDPVKQTEAAGKQKRGAKREEQYELRRDGTRFSSL